MVSVFVGNIHLWASTKTSVQYVDNDCKYFVVYCAETLNLFLVNLLPSINKIVIIIVIKQVLLLLLLCYNLKI